MGKSLIIAEKPSVAKDIAAALGGFSRSGDGVFERSDVVISSAVGHLVTLAVPEGVDKGWDLAVLPLVPPKFALQAIPKTKARLNDLSKLFKRADIDCVVNACDAGREGELIFRYIYLILGCKKPMKRMWLQSMTHDAIKEAYRNMRSGAQMDPLFHAAVSRSEADWLVGINSTRALTKFRELQGKSEGVASAGRVQTPVLTLLYDREMAIRHFVPRDFWEVHGRFGVAAGEYNAKWFNPKHEKTADEAARADRIFDRAKADEIVARCHGVAPSSVTDESKKTSSAPPRLFDLTTLQREANKRFGFSAKMTLDLAQALYEKHKVLTYPRTDASALPEDYVETAKATLGTFSGSGYAEHAERALANGWVKPDKRIFDNSKISDHFAIIPNGQRPGSLSAEEFKLYDMVVKRFIAAFYPAAEYLETTRTTIVAGESFRSAGKVLVSEGWLVVYGREASDDDAKTLCKMVPGEPVKPLEMKAVGMKTTPPERYTEATLLGAMEHAGRMVDDEELQAAMKEKGLGTPATRAAVIEELLSDGKQYARRQAKHLVITEKGIQVIELLRGNNVEALTSPQMTGEWEFKLAQIEKGALSRAAFMEEVRTMTVHIVDQIRQKAKTMPQAPAVDAVVLSSACPKCGGPVHGQGRMFVCQQCALKFWREIAGRTLTTAEADALLAQGETAVLDGFKGRSGKAFSAKLKFDAGFEKIEFAFDDAAPAAPGERERVGACPCCGGDVVVNGDNYDCAKRFDDKACDFRLWGTVAKKRVDRALAAHLLQDRRTGLLDGFVSSKTGKRFSAHLVLASSGKVEFEFEKKA